MAWIHDSGALVGSISCFVRDAIDLNFAIDHHAGLHACASGWMLAEEFLEDGIEGRKIAWIVEPYATADYVLRAIPSFLKDG